MRSGAKFVIFGSKICVWEFIFPGKIAKLPLKISRGGHAKCPHPCVRHCGSQTLLFLNMMLNIFRKERSLHGRTRPSCLWRMGCLLEWYTLRGIGRERDGGILTWKNELYYEGSVVRLDYLPWSCERGKYWRIWFLRDIPSFTSITIWIWEIYRLYLAYTGYREGGFSTALTLPLKKEI